MGSIRVEVTRAPIDLARIAAELDRPEHGAQLIFTGAVRATNDGRRVLAVSYDVYSPLAEKTLTEIGREAQARCEDPLTIVVAHREGRLAVGELSVVIGVSSPHRAEAYEASRYLIEELKERAPIWKKEHYEDGESEWLRGHALCSHRHRSGGRAIHPHGPG